MAKLQAKGIPFPNLLPLIEAIIALFGGCPAPPANKAELQAVRFKRARLALRYSAATGTPLDVAFNHAGSAVETLDESTDDEAAEFLKDVAA